MAEQQESIAAEAERLVTGPRRADYGSVTESFEVVANFWTAIVGHPITPQKVAAMMVAYKLCRETTGAGKRDNLVDLIGYTLLWQQLKDEEDPF